MGRLGFILVQQCMGLYKKLIRPKAELRWPGVCIKQKASARGVCPKGQHHQLSSSSRVDFGLEELPHDGEHDALHTVGHEARLEATAEQAPPAVLGHDGLHRLGGGDGVVVMVMATTTTMMTTMTMTTMMTMTAPPCT